MRIMLDTNVLLSAVIFRSKMMWNMIARIMEDHRLVLSSYVIDECYEVVERKKPSLIPALDRLFESIPFEMVHTPQILPKHGWFTIRDKDDEKADQPSVDVFKWPMTGNCFETVGFRHFSYRCRTMPIKPANSTPLQPSSFSVPSTPDKFFSASLRTE